MPEHQSEPAGLVLTVLKRGSCSSVKGLDRVQHREEAPALAGARHVCHGSSQAGKGLGHLAAAPERLRLQVPPVDARHKLFQGLQRVSMTAAEDERLLAAGESGQSRWRVATRTLWCGTPPLARTWRPPSLGTPPAWPLLCATAPRRCQGSEGSCRGRSAGPGERLRSLSPCSHAWRRIARKPEKRRPADSRAA